jgi:hypothetical protein
MARFNEILAGRYNRFLQKLFQLKGGPPAAQLASEVMPVFPLFAGIENRYLEGWNRFGLVIGFTAVPAVQGAFRFRNPLSSNVIAVVEKILVSVPANGEMLMLHGTSTTDLSTGNNGSRKDARQQVPIITGSSMSLSSENNLAAAPAMTSQAGHWVSFMAANTGAEMIWFEDQEEPVLPGDALQISSNVAQNFAWDLTMTWRERALEDSEQK